MEALEEISRQSSQSDYRVSILHCIVWIVKVVYQASSLWGTLLRNVQFHLQWIILYRRDAVIACEVPG